MTVQQSLQNAFPAQPFGQFGALNDQPVCDHCGVANYSAKQAQKEGLG